ASADVDGFQPAAEVIGGLSPKVVPPLGGDPAFTLFEGATYTGGLLVRAAAFKRAKMGRDLAPQSVFMGLADFCITRGIHIWPYPRPVFRRPPHLAAATPKPGPARLPAFRGCSAADRDDMLAAGYGGRS